MSDPPLPPLPSPPMRAPPPFATLAPGQFSKLSHSADDDSRATTAPRGRGRSRGGRRRGGRARPLPPLPPLPSTPSSANPFVTLRPGQEMSSTSTSHTTSPGAPRPPPFGYVTLPPGGLRSSSNSSATRPKRSLPTPPGTRTSGLLRVTPPPPPPPPPAKPKDPIDMTREELFACIARASVRPGLKKLLKLPFRLDSGQLRGLATDFLGRFVEPTDAEEVTWTSDDFDDLYDELIGFDDDDVRESRERMQIGELRYGVGDESKSVEMLVFRFWDLVVRGQHMERDVALRWAKIVANSVCLLIRVSGRLEGWSEKNVLRKKEPEQDEDDNEENSEDVNVIGSPSSSSSNRFSSNLPKQRRKRFVGDSDDDGDDSDETRKTAFVGIESSSSESEIEIVPDEEALKGLSSESEVESDSDSESEGEGFLLVPGRFDDSEEEEEEENLFDFLTDGESSDEEEVVSPNAKGPEEEENESFGVSGDAEVVVEIVDDGESEGEGEVEDDEEEEEGEDLTFVLDDMVADAEAEFGKVVDDLDFGLSDEEIDPTDVAEDEVVFHTAAVVEEADGEVIELVFEYGAEEEEEEEGEIIEGVVDDELLSHEVIDFENEEEQEFEEEELDGEGPDETDFLNFGYGVDEDEQEDPPHAPAPVPAPPQDQDDGGDAIIPPIDGPPLVRPEIDSVGRKKKKKKGKRGRRHSHAHKQESAPSELLDRSQFEALLKKRFKQYFITHTPGSAGSGRDRFSKLISDILTLSLDGTEDEEEISDRVSFQIPAFPLFTTIYVVILQPALRQIYYEGAMREDALRTVLPLLKPLEVACHITRSHRKLCILQCLFKYYMRIDEAGENDLVLDGDESDDELEEESALVRIERTMEYILEDFRTKKEKNQSLLEREENHLLSVLSVMLTALGRELSNYVDAFENDYVLLGNRLRVYSETLRVWLVYAEEDATYKEVFMANLRKMALHSTRSHFARLKKDVLSGKLGVDGKRANAKAQSGEDSSSDESDPDEEDIRFQDDEDTKEAARQRRRTLQTLTRYITLIDLVMADIRAEAIGVKKVFGKAFENDRQVMTCYLNLLVDDVGEHIGHLEEFEEEHLQLFKKLKEFVVFAVTVHKKIESETVFQTKDLLKRWEKPVQKLIDGWFAKIQNLFYSYLERSIKIETWRPVATGKMFSSSVLDVFTYLRQSAQFLYHICLPDIKRYFFAYAQLCSGLVQKYAVMVLEGLPCDDVSTLAPKRPPMRDIKLRVRLQRMFRKGTKFDARLSEYRNSEAERLRLGERFPYMSLFVRYNDLFYALLQFVRLVTEMQTAWERLNADTHIDPDECQDVKTRFGQMTTATGMILKEHMKGLGEFIAARSVYYELNDVLFVELYNAEVVDNTLQSFIPKYFDPLVEDLEENLMDPRLSRPILAHVFRHFVAALSLVIVDGGELRKFCHRDHVRLERDLTKIGEFFHRRCGLSQSLVESCSSKLRVLIKQVMSKTSQELVDGVLRSNLSYSDLPSECDGRSPWCKGTVYKVLYHREDEVAQRFLKQHTYHYTRLWL